MQKPIQPPSFKNKERSQSHIAPHHLAAHHHSHPNLPTMNIIPTILLALATLCFWRLLNNRRQLNHIPGPALASLSDFWRARLQRNGKLRSELEELHRQHGTVVRYGVRSVSVSNPQVVDIVFGSRAGFVIVSLFIRPTHKRQDDNLTNPPGRLLQSRRRNFQRQRSPQPSHDRGRRPAHGSQEIRRQRVHARSGFGIRIAHRQNDRGPLRRAETKESRGSLCSNGLPDHGCRGEVFVWAISRMPRGGCGCWWAHWAYSGEICSLGEVECASWA